jgi:hypothetical protein
MNYYHLIITAILILVISILYTKNKENFISASESVLNIAKIYSDASSTVNFNNINNIGKITSNDISSNNINTNNINTNNIMINGNLYKRQNRTRYIRVGNKFSENTQINIVDYWTLLELQAFDYSGNNVAENKPVTITAGKNVGASWSSPSNITNGLVGIRDSIDANILYHGDVGVNELEIDLGQEYDLSQIVLFNRPAPTDVFNSTKSTDLNVLAGSERLNNTTIQLFDKDKKLVRRIYTGIWYTTYSKEYIL